MWRIGKISIKTEKHRCCIDKITKISIQYRLYNKNTEIVPIQMPNTRGKNVFFTTDIAN